jgi:hypothetical protein
MDYLDEVRAEAERAIAAMQDAALAARRTHARAELIRHMLTTARKLRDRPRAEAVATAVEEWMRAWHLEPAAWPYVAREMRAMTEAFCDYIAQPSAEAAERIRVGYEALRHALATGDVTLEDHMAWRSRCAHGWWGHVRPAPPELRRPGEAMPDAAFWSLGCKPDCL